MVSYLLPKSFQQTHVPLEAYGPPFSQPTTYPARTCNTFPQDPMPLSPNPASAYSDRNNTCGPLIATFATFYSLQQSLNLPYVLPQSNLLSGIETTAMGAMLTILAADLTYQLWHGQSYPSSLEFRFFVQRVLNITQISTPALILALKLIHTLKLRQPTLCGAPGSECRVFTVGLILANKTHEDNNFTNKTWSKVTGLPRAEINQMEMEFLEALDWRCVVNYQDYLEWMSILESRLLPYDFPVSS